MHQLTGGVWLVAVPDNEWGARRMKAASLAVFFSAYWPVGGPKVEALVVLPSTTWPRAVDVFMPRPRYQSAAATFMPLPFGAGQESKMLMLKLHSAGGGAGRARCRSGFTAMGQNRGQTYPGIRGVRRGPAPATEVKASASVAGASVAGAVCSPGAGSGSSSPSSFVVVDGAFAGSARHTPATMRRQPE